MSYTVSQLREALADFGEGVEIHIDGRPVVGVQGEFRKDRPNVANLLTGPAGQRPPVDADATMAPTQPDPTIEPPLPLSDEEMDAQAEDAAAQAQEAQAAQEAEAQAAADAAPHDDGTVRF